MQLALKILCIKLNRVVYLSLSNTLLHYSLKKKIQLYCVIVLLLLLCSLVGA